MPAADVAQLVEHHLAKVVAGSNPVVRSTKVQVREGFRTLPESRLGPVVQLWPTVSNTGLPSEGVRGSIRKRGSGWQVRVYAGVYEDSGAKRTISRTVQGTKREAEEVLHRLLLEVGDGRHLPSGVTVGDLLDQWWAIKRPTISPTTARDWGSCLRLHIHPHLASHPLHKLRAMDLDRHYRRLLDAGVGPARVRRVHTCCPPPSARPSVGR